jgi:hypothetical protein
VREVRDLARGSAIVGKDAEILALSLVLAERNREIVGESQGSGYREAIPAEGNTGFLCIALV